MKPPPNRGTALAHPRPPERWRRSGSLRRSAYFGLTAALLAFLLWPYVALWQLDRAARSDEAAHLAYLVDLDAVRAEIKKKLNKDVTSRIDTLSDPFLRWLDEAIQSLGNRALERLVTLEWVRGRLLVHRGAGEEDGFLGQISYAFFDAPTGFRVRIGSPEETPVHLRLRLRGLSWRVEALYY